MNANERPTPETDAKHRNMRVDYDDMTDHARRLERERDAWRDVAEELEGALLKRVTRIAPNCHCDSCKALTNYKAMKELK